MHRANLALEHFEILRPLVILKILFRVHETSYSTYYHASHAESNSTNSKKVNLKISISAFLQQKNLIIIIKIYKFINCMTIVDKI